MYKTLLRAFLMLSLAMVHVVQGYAQDQKTTITLASPQAMPGERTYLTSLLTNSPDTSVYHLQHRIEFPKDKLTLVSTRLGIAANLANAVLTVEEQESSGSDEPAVLILTIKGDQAIPDGPVVEATFDVAHIVPQTIVLPHQLEAFDEQGEKISDVVFSDAELHVSADQPDLPPAIFACLFYMH